MIHRLLLAAAGATLVAAAPPTDFKVPIAAGYQPSDKDERGLWLQVEEVERKVKTSAFTIRDPALNDYVRGVFCRTVGEANCADVRIYILRTADFNATIYPTGMMLVYSGLLLRVENEAELAAVLGHEYTHFANRHSLQNFRDVKSKAGIAAWMSMIPVPGIAGAAAMAVARLGVVGSIFSFSREKEREADAGSIPLMANAGYAPSEAPKIWEQLRAEQDATAVARNTKSRKDKDGGIFGSHPPTKERVETLRALATAQPVAGTPTEGRAVYRAALAPWWPALVDDQIKLNDFGGTDFVINKLASDGWTADLLYARGELYRTRGRPEDLITAAEAYRQAIAMPDAPAEAWRGLGLVELRGGRDLAGREALSTYLRKKPEASDRGMMAMMAGETN